MTKSVIKESTNVIAIFPVTLAEPGRSPNKLLTKMKKNRVDYVGDVFKDLCAMRQLDLVIGSQVMLLNNLYTA